MVGNKHDLLWQLFNIYWYLQMHVKGEVNCIGYTLSRHSHSKQLGLEHANS